jgi:zinc transport system substrate-binding protein
MRHPSLSFSFIHLAQGIAAVLFVTFTLHVPALAEPKVVASIRPVQALVYAVMGEIGVPDVLLEPGASPHIFALKPSQAQMLQDADIIFWIGPGLEAALNDPLQNLTANARLVRLIEAPGLDLIHFDEDDEEAVHDDHDHDHGAVDPHIWLSPANAGAMIDTIANELSQLTPGNAEIYAKNAKVAKNRLKLLAVKMGEILAHSQGVPYMVTHDGFGYIKRDFGMNQVGYLQIIPGREPGAKHITQLREAIATQGVKCLFTEPQFTPALAQRLAEETGVRLGELDPMGGALELSPTLHVRIIQQLVLGMDHCLYTNPVDTPAEQ